MIDKINGRKALFDGDLWEKYIVLAEKSKIPYTISQSTYTIKLDSAFLKREWMQNMMSEKTFKAYNKIKGDIKKKGLTPPDIDRRDLEYYKFDIPDKLKRAKRTIYNIDIKSAYASVLLNEGVIFEKTFNYMASLSKKDRLACVGMLASNKHTFFYDEAGELCSLGNENNHLAGFFYLCILKVQQVMSKIKNAIGNDFLFYWVDGVYFNSLKSKTIIEGILIDSNFNYTFETLTDVRVNESGKRLSMFFKKEDGREKIFRIPKEDFSINRKLIDLLSIHDPANSIIKKTKK